MEKKEKKEEKISHMCESIGHWPFQGRCPKSIPVPNPSHHGPNIPQCKLGTNKPPRLIKSIQNTITIADIHPHANWVPTNHLAYPRRHHHVSYTPPMQTRYQPTTSPTKDTIKALRMASFSAVLVRVRNTSKPSLGFMTGLNLFLDNYSNKKNVWLFA